ncbi:MAG: hypothetical protein EBZ48_10535 [Proteobacteria bacterium]|nr:hypothetical protein [Pseudomonadota bacterium]
MHYSSKDEHVFLGRDLGKPREHSESTQIEIDREVRAILDSQYGIARKIISENIEVLHRMAKAVMERETLDSDDIEKLIKGETLPPLAVSEPSSTSTGGGNAASSDDTKDSAPSGVLVTA